MILPTKHISVQESLLGVGAVILVHLEQPKTVSTLWNRVREIPEVKTFERFTLVLDLLYMIGAIEFDRDRLRRAKR